MTDPSMTKTRLAPDFIVIGAMKAGTTTLYQYCDHHPQIGMSRLKETDYFLGEKAWSRGADWYASQFTPGFELYGEASPNYTKARDFPGVPERIHAALPEVKLIYVVRDPIDRFVSQYKHSFLMGALDETPEAIRGGHEWGHMLDASLYNAQLSRYREMFDDSRILILDFDQLVSAPQAALSRVAAFLGVQDVWPDAVLAANTSDGVAATPKLFFAARRLGLTDMVRPFVPAGLERRLKGALARGPKRAAPPFSADLRQAVADAVADDVAAFRAATGMAFSQWRV